jgi:hypothetical protein
MLAAMHWPRILTVAGLILMSIGIIDPLEGSIIILAGSGMIALDAFLGKNRRQRMLLWAFGMTAAGVAALFWLSAVGGLGGNTGHSYWWGLMILPYPAGWLLGLWGAIANVMEFSKRRAQ